MTFSEFYTLISLSEKLCKFVTNDHEQRLEIKKLKEQVKIVPDAKN